MKRQSKRAEERRAAWMREFEECVVDLDPRHAGRICWDTATYYYISGYMAMTSAAAYVANRIDKEVEQ